MKRIIPFLILFAALSLQCAAQNTSTDDDDVEKNKSNSISLRLPTGVGNYIVGANLLFANATFLKGSETSYNFGLNPKLGFFALPNIALGLSGSLSVEGHKGYSAINYGVSPFARIYFAHNNEEKPARPVQFFVEAGVGFGGTNTRTDDANGFTRNTTNGIRLYLLPGVDYFINDHVAAELGVEYIFIGGKPDAHIIGLNLGFQIFMGR